MTVTGEREPGTWGMQDLLLTREVWGVSFSMSSLGNFKSH